MPIVFAPPSPVAPQLSAAGGAAQVMTQDFPALASFYSHMASLRASQQPNYGAQQMQQTALQMQANNQQADRDQQMAMQGNAEQAASGQIDQRARAAAWLNQQELTQTDQMAMQQMQNGVAAINKDPNLTPDEKANAITMIQTKLNPLKQRQQLAEQKAQTELLQQHAKLYQAQTASEADATLYKQQALEGKQMFDMDPTAVPALTDEVATSMGIPTESLPQQGTMIQGLVQAKVQQLAEERGLGHHYIWDEKKGKVANPFELETMRHRAAGAAKSVSDQAQGVADSYKHHSDTIGKDWAEAVKSAETTDENGKKKPGSLDDIETHFNRLREIREREDQKFQGKMGGGTGQPYTAKNKAEAIETFNENIHDITNRFDPRITDQKKSDMVRGLQKARGFIEKYGNAMPPEVMKEFRRIQGEWKALPPRPEPVAPESKVPESKVPEGMMPVSSGGFIPKNASEDAKMLASITSSHEGNMQQFLSEALQAERFYKLGAVNLRQHVPSVQYEIRRRAALQGVNIPQE